MQKLHSYTTRVLSNDIIKYDAARSTLKWHILNICTYTCSLSHFENKEEGKIKNPANVNKFKRYTYTYNFLLCTRFVEMMGVKRKLRYKS